MEDEVSDRVTSLAGFASARTPGRPRFDLLRRLGMMLEVRRTRRILAEMDPYLLKDIGISRAEAEAESTRALWDFELRR
jgi:uncharacterized protein YjiS (DUF1127 family)